MTKKLDLRNASSTDDDKAREHLESLPWPQCPVCPRCGVTEDRITKPQGQEHRPGVYKCKDGRKPFCVTVGTVMERSHIPPAPRRLIAFELRDRAPDIALAVA